ncbi:electron transport complex subunit RsxG [Thiomicrospira sp. ALE5]|uniref:electron transport complex subunit RsxG n=1 Tax=Thiomicrospira sp. ALE5 TaxID=748650 RepID=UPI0008EB31E7|nr:electron transport complex subunit RsxG [Thiomicrospira sp. ALE5]SFR58668.1 electron transport complex protein RnfG [Thiomicrospira sp. ALE5]
MKTTTLSTTMLRAAGLMGLFVVVSVGLLVAVNSFTQPKIAEVERQVMLNTLNQVMPTRYYNNNLIEDMTWVTAPDALGTTQPMPIYRARLDGEPAGLVIETIAPDGYSGNIHLLMGVFADGRIAGVRVLSHRETPGLGDKIELRKDNWILSFNGRQLTKDNAHTWAVKRDRGDFEQFTGATITPRAVINAVKHTLDYVNLQGVRLYE